MTWKLSEAKNKFSEVVRLALNGEPQRVERNGGDAVVVIDAVELERLQGGRPSFKEFLFSGPDVSELELERDQAPLRELDL